MQVELLVTDDCPACEKAAAVWRAACTAAGAELAVRNLGEPETLQLARRWRLGTVPAVIIDGELMAVGVQDDAQARSLLEIAATRTT